MGNDIYYVVKNIDSDYKARLIEDWNKLIRRNDIQLFNCTEQIDESTGQIDLQCTIRLMGEGIQNDKFKGKNVV